MSENLTDEQKDRFHLMALAQTYQQMAWVALGKIANPATQKVERELGQASWSIDTLAMLERVTKGNIPEEDSREIAQMVYTLRMNYVDEAAKPDESSPEEADAGAEAESAGDQDSTQPGSDEEHADE